MSGSAAAIERIYRRIMLMVGRGRIKIGTDDQSVQKQQVKMGQFETFDDIPRLSEYGFNSMPPAESDAVLVFVGGNRLDGVIIATGNQTFRMRSLKPGEVSISDNLGQSVYLSQTGIVVNGAGLPMMLTNTPEVTLDTPLVHMTGDANVDGNLTVGGNANVTGNVVAKGDVSDHSNKSMAGMRQVFNSHTHVIQQVQSGQSTLTSNQPNQSE
ncbi:phage baseplate assembly protein V [Undibacterium sp. SXout20W]|uniref:phage baseplate assembly protein V n=1 Tax=Undibacterium sp. SXout20W TaxID=3413051 RepID=UPI003BF37FBE